MKFSGSQIAAAFNRPDPMTRCGACPHPRSDHRRVIVKPGLFDGIEVHYECEEPDGRTKSGRCKCGQFTDPAVPGIQQGEKP